MTFLCLHSLPSQIIGNKPQISFAIFLYAHFLLFTPTSHIVTFFRTPVLSFFVLSIYCIFDDRPRTKLFYQTSSPAVEPVPPTAVVRVLLCHISFTLCCYIFSLTWRPAWPFKLDKTATARCCKVFILATVVYFHYDVLTSYLTVALELMRTEVRYLI